MPPSGKLTAPELQTLLQDGTLVGSWNLDPARSEVRLASKSYWGLGNVKGVFTQVNGNGNVAADGTVTGMIMVTAASVDTKNKQRDNHLRSGDFFDVSEFADITFVVDTIKPSDAGVTVTGKLTVRDRANQVSFPASISAGDDEVTFDGELNINRGDYGLTWNRLGMVSLDNTITIHAVFTR